MSAHHLIAVQSFEYYQHFIWILHVNVFIINNQDCQRGISNHRSGILNIERCQMYWAMRGLLEHWSTASCDDGRCVRGRNVNCWSVNNWTPEKDTELIETFIMSLHHSPAARTTNQPLLQSMFLKARSHQSWQSDPSLAGGNNWSNESLDTGTMRRQWEVIMINTTFMQILWHQDWHLVRIS